MNQKLSASNKLAIFKGRKIRRTIYNNKWWFVINDIIEALTESQDSAQYFKKLKQRDEELAKFINKKKGGGYNLYTPYD